MNNKVFTLETTKYAIQLENFEGPLDLLCHLIDKDKVDIYKVKISDIADQYIEYLNEMEKLNLEIASEFIVMASTLILIKSKGLLPKEADDEAELLKNFDNIVNSAGNLRTTANILAKNVSEFQK